MSEKFTLNDIMSDDGLSRIAQEVKAYDQKLADATKRQDDPKIYALLHANGMPFSKVIELACEDAFTVCYAADCIEGDGHR